MIDIARELARVRYPVLAVSALAWGTLAAAPSMHVAGMGVYCAAAGISTASIDASLSMSLALTPPSALASGWALMLIAMMLPLLTPEIHHIRFMSLTRRRTRSIAFFLAGYGGVWMVWGAALTGAALVARAMVPESYILPTVTGLIACVWQASPFKQYCLNKCHDRPPLRVFGLEADLDAFRFGRTQGIWCTGACGWLMLFLVLLPKDHLMAMVLVAILIFCERLEDPEPPQWKMRGFGKVGRIMAARIRIHRRIRRQNLIDRQNSQATLK